MIRSQSDGATEAEVVLPMDEDEIITWFGPNGEPEGKTRERFVDLQPAYEREIAAAAE